jgi:hypothetical protein
MSETTETGKESDIGPRRRRRRHRRRGGGRRALAVFILLGLIAVAVLGFIFMEIASSLNF